MQSEFLALTFTVFASCLALLRAPYQNPSTHSDLDFLFASGEEIFGKHWQNLRLIELKAFFSNLSDTHVFITAASAPNGPFAWRDLKKCCS